MCASFGTADGKLFVERLDAERWHIWAAEPGPDRYELIGLDRDLPGLLADAFGYDIAHVEIPNWFDDLALDVRQRLPAP